MSCLSANVCARVRRGRSTAPIVASATLRRADDSSRGDPRRRREFRSELGHRAHCKVAARTPATQWDSRRMALGPGEPRALLGPRLGGSKPFHERVDAAVAGGFSGISLWARDYFAARRSGFSPMPTALAARRPRPCRCRKLEPHAWSWLPGASNFHPYPTRLDHPRSCRTRRSRPVPHRRSTGCASVQRDRSCSRRLVGRRCRAAFGGLLRPARGARLLVHIESSGRIERGARGRIVRRADRDKWGARRRRGTLPQRWRVRCAAGRSGRSRARPPTRRRARGSRARSAGGVAARAPPARGRGARSLDVARRCARSERSLRSGSRSSRTISTRSIRSRPVARTGAATARVLAHY